MVFSTYFMTAFRLIKTAIHLGTVLPLIFHIQLFHSQCIVISQLNWLQIARQSSEQGLRPRVAHFDVSKGIRLIFVQKLYPEALSIN